MLRTADSAQAQLSRHYAYLTLLPAMDRRNESANREFRELAGPAQRSLGTVDSVVRAIDSTRLQLWLRTEKQLVPYSFYIGQARASTRRVPSAADAARINEWAQVAAAGPGRFQSTMRAVDLGTVVAPEGSLDVRTQGGEARTHAVRSVREAVYRRNNQGLATRRDTFADILTGVAAARNSMSRAQGFADYRDESYGARYLSVADVRRLLVSLRDASVEHREYERFRVAQLQQRFGYSQVRWWDLAAPPPGRVAPRFTISEATTIALASAKPIGPDYVTELAALLDPRNGRIDVAPGPYRVERPGFSTGLVGYPSHFFQGRYSGFVDDLVILVHEAGHAAQNMMMDRRGVLPRYAFGPGYFTESFAALSEMLTLEHLARSSADTALRIYYMERLLDQTNTVFRTGFEAMFEDSVYVLAGQGQKPGADELERLHHGIASQFSIWYGPNSDVELGWVQPNPFYVWPLYHVNYVLANLLAFNYLQQLKTDSAGFQRRYQSLLSRGYDASPTVLLREEMGIDLTDAPKLVTTAQSVLREWRRELESLTRVQQEK